MQFAILPAGTGIDILRIFTGGTERTGPDQTSDVCVAYGLFLKQKLRNDPNLTMVTTTTKYKNIYLLNKDSRRTRGAQDEQEEEFQKSIRRTINALDRIALT